MIPEIGTVPIFARDCFCYDHRHHANHIDHSKSVFTRHRCRHQARLRLVLPVRSNQWFPLGAHRSRNRARLRRLHFVRTFRTLAGHVRQFLARADLAASHGAAQAGAARLTSHAVRGHHQGVNLFNFTLLWPDLWSKFAAQEKTVLVVENDPSDIELIRWGAAAEGLSIEVAGSAEEALGILHRNGRHFCHVLIDVGLPGMDGWALRDKLTDAWPDLPVCMMSGHLDSLIHMPKGEKVSVLLKSSNYGLVLRGMKNKKIV